MKECGYAQILRLRKNLMKRNDNNQQNYEQTMTFSKNEQSQLAEKLKKK